MLFNKTKRINNRKFGFYFEALGPDGKWQTVDAETGEDLRTVQLVSNTVGENPEGSETVLVENPFVVIDNNCLSPFPQPGETWLFKIPPSSKEGDDAPENLKIMAMSRERLFQDDYLGVTRIYLQEVEQSDNGNP
jgi:hypothetical protein